MFEIGQIVNEENYTEAAVFCNKSNDRHIELVDDAVYRIVANDPIPEPTKEEIVAKMEAETGMTRAMREIVLSNDISVSEYVKQVAQDIEEAARELRKDI